MAFFRLSRSTIFQCNAFSWALALCALFCLLMLLPSPSWAGGSIYISSSHQRLEPFTGVTQLDGGVVIKTDDAQMSSSSATMVAQGGQASVMNLNGGAQVVRKEGSLHQVIRASHIALNMSNSGVEADGGVNTQMSDTAHPADNVNIQSDDQVFDQANNVMRAIGHVKVTKGGMVAVSPEALITMGDDGQAKKALFKGGAKLTNAERVLTGEVITIDLATGDIYAEKNTKSEMKATDKQGQTSDVKVTSQFQELNQNTGMLIANGDAVVTYGDFIAKGPKATFYTEKNTLDHITMTGRSEIVDKDRKVVGDTIVITINPRQFTAKGNVQSFMQAKNKPKPDGKKDPKKDDATAKSGKPSTGKAKDSGSKSASSSKATSRGTQKPTLPSTKPNLPKTATVPPKVSTPKVDEAALNEALMMEEAAQ